jgi:lipooligosaccharide transport system permease protein
MITTPASLEDVVAGELAWAAGRSVVYAFVLMVVLALFGLLQSPWALAIPVAALAGGFLFSVVGLTYTALSRHMDHLTFYFTLFTTPMFLFSGIFFPLDKLPPWVQWAANLTPLYHLVYAIRGFALGDVTALVWIHLAVVVAATIVLFPLPAFILRKKILR